MDAAASVVFEKLSGWCGEAQGALARTFGEGGAPWIAGEVNAGRCELWKINGGSVWLITRVRDGALVIECLQGRGLQSMAPVLYRIAQRNGLQAVEFLTRRPALARMLQGYGLQLMESTPWGNVYRCEVRREQ